jgi:Trm5-related predicted tRNA methylase
MVFQVLRAKFRSYMRIQPDFEELLKLLEENRVVILQPNEPTESGSDGS